MDLKRCLQILTNEEATQVHKNLIKWLSEIMLINLEAVIQRCSYKNMFWKYAGSLRKNTQTEVRF